VALRDFGLKAPPVLGLIKVHDEVIVTAYMTLRSLGAGAVLRLVSATVAA